MCNEAFQKEEEMCISSCNVSVDFISAVIPDNDNVTKTIKCNRIRVSRYVSRSHCPKLSAERSTVSQYIDPIPGNGLFRNVSLPWSCSTEFTRLDSRPVTSIGGDE